MAKRRGNKSNAIRAILAEKPDATVKEIQAALKAKRIRASVALIGTLKYGKKRGRQTSTNGHVSMDGLLAAKSLVAQLGSIEAARSALDSYAKLVG